MTLLDAPNVPLVSEPRHQARAPAQVRAPAWSAATTALVLAVLVGAAAIAFARWQIDRTVVPWDSKNHFYPMFRFLGDALRHGGVPLWNPYHFGGYPAVADPQSLIFTPTMALLAFLLPGVSMAGFDAIVLAHLVAGGAGLVGLARRWRWHPAAALLMALVFVFGGSAASRLQHTGMIVSYAFFPLALWSLVAALDRRSIPLALAAGVLAALMTLGRDQVAFLLCIALAGCAVARIANAERPGAYFKSRWPYLLLAGMTTVALVAVPALLTMQFLHDSNRPGIALGMALEGSLDPVNLLTLLCPDIFGSLDKVYDYWGPGAATLAGNDWTDRTIDYLFCGTLPLVLVAWHGLAGRRLFEREAVAATVIAATALLYAFGRHTPFFEFAFDWVPGVSLYRRPADATFLANLGLALLGGYLLHRFIVAGVPRRPAATALAPAAALLVGSAWLAGSGLTFAAQTGHLAASLKHMVVSVAVATTCALALYAGRAPRWRAPVSALLVVVTAGQLVWRNAASPLNAEPASTYSAYSGLYPDQARGLAVLLPEIAAREAKGEHPRVEILGLDGSWQNAAMILKLQDSIGYNPLRIAAYERAVGVGESAGDLKLRSFPDSFRGYNSHLARLLGIEYLIIDRAVADLPRRFPRPRGTLLFAGDHFYIYRLDGPTAPRAYLATRLRPIDGALQPFDDATEALIDRADLPRLHDADLVEAGAPAAAAQPSQASIESYGDDRVAVDVEAAGPGVLVLHDLFYPGWTATVDGVSAPLLHANLLFRGVEVGPGHHRVEFSYHPFALGNLVAAATDALHTGDR